MSVTKNYYVIAGYDLTNIKTDKYDDWKWTNEGEGYTCNQSKGHIQLFDDPMNGDYLYLGYVLANGDKYVFDTVNILISEIENIKWKVYEKLIELARYGVIKDNVFDIPKYKIIVFEECT